MPTIRTEGGHARGHSRMDHRDNTAVVKARTRRARRTADKAACADRD